MSERIKAGGKVYGARLYCGAVEVVETTVKAVDRNNVATLAERHGVWRHMVKVETGRLHRSRQDALAALVAAQSAHVRQCEESIAADRADLAKAVAALEAEIRKVAP